MFFFLSGAARTRGQWAEHDPGDIERSAPQHRAIDAHRSRSGLTATTPIQRADAKLTVSTPTVCCSARVITGSTSRDAIESPRLSRSDLSGALLASWTSRTIVYPFPSMVISSETDVDVDCAICAFGEVEHPQRARS